MSKSGKNWIVIIVVVLVLLGIWYFWSKRSSMPTENMGAPNASAMDVQMMNRTNVVYMQANNQFCMDQSKAVDVNVTYGGTSSTIAVGDTQTISVDPTTTSVAVMAGGMNMDQPVADKIVFVTSGTPGTPAVMGLMGDQASAIPDDIQACQPPQPQEAQP